MNESWTIAVLAAATAAAGILRGYSGFGGALVMAPAFLRVTSPAEDRSLRRASCFSAPGDEDHGRVERQMPLW